MKTETAFKNFSVSPHPAYISFYHSEQEIGGKDMRKKCKEDRGRIGGWEGHWRTTCILSKTGKQNFSSKVSVDRVGIIVHSEAIHSDGLDLNRNVPQGPYLETSGPWVHPLRGKKCFSFAYVWSVKYLEPDYNLIINRPGCKRCCKAGS